jgi:hypothetical protein
VLQTVFAAPASRRAGASAPPSHALCGYPHVFVCGFATPPLTASAYSVIAVTSKGHPTGACPRQRSSSHAQRRPLCLGFASGVFSYPDDSARAGFVVNARFMADVQSQQLEQRQRIEALQFENERLRCVHACSALSASHVQTHQHLLAGASTRRWGTRRRPRAPRAPQLRRSSRRRLRERR